jgi:F-box protein 21
VSWLRNLPKVLALTALPTRYYSNALLGSIHRAAAVREWYDTQFKYLQNFPGTLSPATGAIVTPTFGGEPAHDLERLVGAFDRFVLGGFGWDAQVVSDLLDALAVAFSRHEPGLDAKTIRQKALALNHWLRARNLTGMNDPDRDYRNLRNCFIGQALLSPDHDSLPIVSCAIYSCIAQRVGIPAACCLFPAHVHVVVTAPRGLTLDGGKPVKPLQPSTSTTPAPVEKMYLDPYGADEEVKLVSMHRRLAEYGHPPAPHFFSAAPPSAVARRIAANISAAYESYAEGARPGRHPGMMRLSLTSDPHPHYRHHNHMGSYQDDELNHAPGQGLVACYASCWARAMLGIPGHLDVNEWNESSALIMSMANDHFPGDRWLIDKYLMPVYVEHAAARPFPGFHRNGLLKPRLWANTMRSRPFPRVALSQPMPAGVRFHLGQPVRHQNHNWVALVAGWTLKERSRDRAFGSSESPPPYYIQLRLGYHAEQWITSQEHLVAVTDPADVPEELKTMAGIFFDRFDPDACKFVCGPRVVLEE